MGACEDAYSKISNAFVAVEGHANGYSIALRRSTFFG
jgi:hypothetical protein